MTRTGCLIALLLAGVAAAASPLGAQEPGASRDLTPEERHTAYDAATRRLIGMKVLAVSPGADYCVVLRRADDEAEAMVRRLLGTLRPGAGHVDPIPPDPTDCLTDVGFRRYVLEEPQRAEDGSIAVKASGDHLAEWPPGLDGIYWGRWSARCRLVEGDPDAAECAVSSVASGDGSVDERYLRRRGRFFDTTEGHSAGGRPARLVARNAASARADTVEFGVESVPYVYDLPVLSPGQDRCTASSLLSAGSTWPPNGHRLLRIELATGIEFAPWAARLMNVVQDRNEGGEGRVIVVQCGEPRAQPFAITTLEGVGPPLAGPVRHCPDNGCPREVTVPMHDPLPLVHRFRLSDFDFGDEGEGDTVHLQFETDGWGSGLLPFLVILGDRPWAEAFRPTWHSRHHRIPLNRAARFEGDPEVLLYLVRR